MSEEQAKYIKAISKNYKPDDVKAFKAAKFEAVKDSMRKDNGEAELYAPLAGGKKGGRKSSPKKGATPPSSGDSVSTTASSIEGATFAAGKKRTVEVNDKLKVNVMNFWDIDVSEKQYTTLKLALLVFA